MSFHLLAGRRRDRAAGPVGRKAEGNTLSPLEMVVTAGSVFEETPLSISNAEGRLSLVARGSPSPLALAGRVCTPMFAIREGSSGEGGSAVSLFATPSSRWS